MNLNQLEYFRTLAKIEHVTQAAKILSISQPSLSKAIQELEKELGVPLFDRIGKKIKLTKYGSLYLKYVDQGLEHLLAGKRELDEILSPSKGHIDICFVYTLGSDFIPKLVTAFGQEYPEATITFSYQQTNSKQNIQSLLDGAFDLSFCSYIDEPSIEFVRIFEQEMVVIVPRSHPWAQRKTIDLREIQNEKFIAYEQNSGIRPTIDKMLVKSEVCPQIIAEFEEDYTIAGFVGQGFGISIVPKLKGLDAFDVVSLKIKPVYYERFVYLAHVKGRYLSPPARLFYEFSLDYCQKNFLSKNISI